MAKQYLEEDGVHFIFNSSIDAISNEVEKVLVSVNGETQSFDVLLYATGRRPNTNDLGL